MFVGANKSIRRASRRSSPPAQAADREVQNPKDMESLFMSAGCLFKCGHCCCAMRCPACRALARRCIGTLVLKLWKELVSLFRESRDRLEEAVTQLRYLRFFISALEASGEEIITQPLVDSLPLYVIFLSWLASSCICLAFLAHRVSHHGQVGLGCAN